MLLTIVATILSLISLAHGGVLVPYDDGPVDISDYPFIVSIDFIGVHMCSGVLISETFVLSENMFCTTPFPAYDYTVRYNITRTDNYPNIVQVVDIYQHPNFTVENAIFDYDYSVVQLEEPIVGVPFAKLPEVSYDLPEGTALTVAGYEYHDSVLYQQLITADSSLITNQECNELYANRATDRLLCVTCLQKAGQYCVNDFGAALIAADGTIFGLLHNQFNPADDPSQPAVFIRISVAREWINFITGV